ncbi:MAG: arsenate reductase (azurin) small subunit [Candidatus Hydrogenedentes bacterium]|nr:arsenate reductase (azurin) small subunit [Candidatus Hydrogenedentota bacterium]
MHDDTAALGAGVPQVARAVPCTTRREFLLFAGATTVGLGALGLAPAPALFSRAVSARVAEYPRKRIGLLSALQINEPVKFHYPFEEPHCSSLLVRLGTPAGGGVGPAQDIVAFNQLCTHMGGLIEGQYQREYRVLGPCPIHLSTFDLTRHGIVVAGHATDSLPQVILELEGDDIVAKGVLGLLYGYNNNLA